MRRALALALMGATCLALAQPTEIAAFSMVAPGTPLPGAWKERSLRSVPMSQMALVDDGGDTVLEVKSRSSAGAVTYALRHDAAARPVLAWRWKVDRVVASADLEQRSGDDFAARVYVFFDVPLDALPWFDRVKVLLARLIYGEELPTAGICYVWDNRHPAGMSVWSAYTDRIRVVVAESGAARAGEWVEERRDVEGDFRAAFGEQWPGAMPGVTGVAAGNDTDQTGESVVAHFGDLRFEARR
jgi:hypothetical protein